MSNAPPPYLSSPGPPGPFEPPGLPSLQPGQAPRKSSKLPYVIGGVVALAVIAVVVVLALGGGDDQDSKAVSAKSAHEGLQTVLDDSSFDDSGTDDLRECPLGNLDDLYDTVAAAIEIDPAVANGVDEKSAQAEADLPGFVSCQRYVEDESKVDNGPTSVFFQAVLDPPRDYKGYATDFAGDITDITFDRSVQYLGGEVVMYCAEASEDGGFTGCDADWVDKTNKISFAVFLGGADTTSEDAFTALKVVLGPMADSLAKSAG